MLFLMIPIYVVLWIIAVHIRYLMRNEKNQDKFKGVPYKLVATATPSPNRYKELIHYAGYLEVMDTGQALTRFFKRDSTKANNLTLYPNMEDEFWLWVSSWALFITKPSDLNPEYSDVGCVKLICSDFDADLRSRYTEQLINTDLECSVVRPKCGSGRM